MARILVIEDFPPVAASIARSLRRCGHRVVVATTVQAAVSPLGHFDCATVDIELPDGCGVDAAGLLIADRRLGFAVFFSGCGEPDLRRRASELGLLVDKSAGIEKLCSTVEVLLQEQEREAVAVGESRAPPGEGGNRRGSGVRRVVR
jgi:DNA-binding response OmpR family regulator